MNNKNLLHFLVLLLLCCPLIVSAQTNFGMATGNYAGITGVWLNPASIADSRYKFDINIIGYDSYFENNYLLVRKDAFLRRIFYKEPYSSSYPSTQNDLLEEQWPLNKKVYGIVESNIQLPLSFMVSTGEKSAIAFSMNNRSVNQVGNLNPELAKMFFNALAEPSLYGKDINADSMQYNFLNWQEVGLTYSRVLIQNNHQQFKMGATVKWLGANAGGYIQTDQATVNFTDNNTLSLNSPLIHYARTEAADLDKFSRRDLFNNLADQSFGWDIGFVYEFRARVKKFQFLNESLDTAIRRDMNKYMFRFGLSLVDNGKFTLEKMPLTNDHAANIDGWDFSSVHASNFSEFDSAYSQQVQYVQGAPSTFTYHLPSAMIGNFDLHLAGPFYINAAAKVHLRDFGRKTDTYINADRWTVITPRFEAKSFGLYIPVSRSHKRTNVGATVRLGPFYVGSNNLLELLTNSKTQEADFHVGFRFSVPYGKPTRMSAFLQSLVSEQQQMASDKTAIIEQLDSLKLKVAVLEDRHNDSMRSRGVNIYIQNAGVESSLAGNSSDSILIQNSISKKFIQDQDSLNGNINQQTDSLLYALALKNLESEQLKRELDKKEKEGKAKSKKSKSDNKPIKVEVSNADLQKEVQRMRQQMAIQNATLITAVALSGDKDDSKTEKSKADEIRSDSVKAVAAKKDTVVIKDTIMSQASNATLRYDSTQNFEPVTFSSGSYTVSVADRKRLEEFARTGVKDANWLVEVTAVNDASGSVAVNRNIAAARIKAVTAILLKNGVKDSQILTRTQLENGSQSQKSKNPRRVELRVLHLN